MFSVPLIVAINKIDKHNADVTRTKSTLYGLGLDEDNTAFVPISALKVKYQVAEVIVFHLLN